MKRCFSSAAIAAVVGFLFQAPAGAGEPAFCQDLDHPRELSTPQDRATFNRQGTDGDRVRVFQIGKLVFSGIPVGNWGVKNVLELQPKFHPPFLGSKPKHCVWYVNKANEDAQTAFHHFYLPKPQERGAKEAYARLFDYLATPDPDAPAGSVPDLVQCAESGALDGGCDGERHRGPTWAAIVFALAGCDPDRATRFVNATWGLNGIPPEDRLARVTEAYQYGKAHPEFSDRLAGAFAGIRKQASASVPPASLSDVMDLRPPAVAADVDVGVANPSSKGAVSNPVHGAF